MKRNILRSFAGIYSYSAFNIYINDISFFDDLVEMCFFEQNKVQCHLHNYLTIVIMRMALHFILLRKTHLRQIYSKEKFYISAKMIL